MKLIPVVVVLLVAVLLTCTARLSSPRKRLHKRQVMPANPPPTMGNATQTGGCVSPTGMHMPVGKEITLPQPGMCHKCRCDKTGLFCFNVYCMAPMCVDFIRPGCCYECPKGQNCQLPTGEIISYPVVRGGMRCECPQPDYDIPGFPAIEDITAICSPLYK